MEEVSLNSLDQRVGRLEQRFNGLEEKLERLEITVSKIDIEGSERRIVEKLDAALNELMKRFQTSMERKFGLKSDGIEAEQATNDEEDQHAPKEEELLEEAQHEEQELPPYMDTTADKKKKSRRLTGNYEQDGIGAESAWKTRTFVQNLSYIFQYAAEGKRSKAKYVEQANNVFGRKELSGFQFNSQSIITMAKTLVKILREIEACDIGLLQPTDFVSKRILALAVKAYQRKYGLTRDSILSRQVHKQFNDISNFLDESTGFGALVMSVMLTAEQGDGVAAITNMGFNKLHFWAPNMHGIRYSNNVILTQLDIYAEVFDVICAIGHLLLYSI